MSKITRHYSQNVSGKFSFDITRERSKSCRLTPLIQGIFRESPDVFLIDEIFCKKGK